MTRALPFLLVALLAGCKREAAPDTAPVAAPVAASLPTMPCALGGAHAFAEDCTVERVAAGEGEKAGWTLVIHHPDGGFRRLDVTSDGRGVAAADGALPARVTVLDAGTIEIAVAGDRYHLPATIKGS